MKYAAPRAKGGFETCFFADGLLYEATSGAVFPGLEFHVVFEAGILIVVFYGRHGSYALIGVYTARLRQVLLLLDW